MPVNVRIGERERRYVEEVLASQFRSSAGSRMTSRLEALFAEKFGAAFAISFINGTATMHAALAAMGTGPGDEVIVPPLTMAATSMAVLQAGAVPVFCDIDPHMWNMDAGALEKCITPRTRAIIPVSIYGLPADLERIVGLARRFRLRVLEDDAQCFLGAIDGRMAGTIGDASSFSFQSSKHMTSGEGGMVLTGDPELAEGIRRFASLGYAAVSARPGGSKISKDAIQNPDYERHLSTGWNYRLPELCAAVALGQLERLEDLVACRVAAADTYREALGNCRWLTPQLVPAGYRHSYWTYVVYLEESAPCTWRGFREKFLEFGGDPFYGAWRLTYLEPAFRDRRFAPHQAQEYRAGLCPVGERVQPRLVQLKTNYFDAGEARAKAAALRKTIAFFGG